MATSSALRGTPLAAGRTPTPSASIWGSRPQFRGPGKGPPHAGHSKTPESPGEADNSALTGLWAQYHHQPPGYPCPVSSCASTFLTPLLCSLATRRSGFSHVLVLTGKGSGSEAEEAQTPARGHTGRKQQRLASPAPSPVFTVTRLPDLLSGVIHGAQTMGWGLILPVENQGRLHGRGGPCFCYKGQAGFPMGTRWEGTAARGNNVCKGPEAWPAPADPGLQGAL